MIECIEITTIEHIYDQMPFPYRAYRKWLDADTDLPAIFHTIGSCTAKIRSRNEWNELGREIYDVGDIERHAAIVARILRDFGLTVFLIQQSMPTGAWFRGSDGKLKGRANAMVKYLQSRGVSLDFTQWRGVFIVREDIGDFLKWFLDYPFTWNTYDLEIYSMQEPLIMVCNHHLCVEYISSDLTLAGRLRTRILSEGILEYPDRCLTDHG